MNELARPRQMSFNGYYFRLAHLSKRMRLVVKTIWLATRIEAVATFLIIFGAHMNILFIVKVNILVLIKWSYRSPQLCWLTESRMVIIFWARRPISFTHMSFWYLFLGPHQITYHSNIGVLIKKVTGKG